MAKTDKGTSLGELINPENPRNDKSEKAEGGGQAKKEPERRFTRAEQFVIAEAAALAAREPPKYDLERHCNAPNCDGLMQLTGSNVVVTDPHAGGKKRVQHIVCDRCGVQDKIVIPGRYSNPPRNRLRKSEIAAQKAAEIAAEMKRRK